MLKDMVKKTTRGSFLYPPLRDAYRFIFNRDYCRRRNEMLAFYARMISKDDLVFDVGANSGEYTEMFLELGAQVVAIEPNPRCAALVEQIRPRQSVRVIRAALGDAKSEAILHVCDQSGLSTISSERLDVVRQTPRLAGRDWSHSVRVPVTTLDTLIAEFGSPQFIKIDVEGYEQKVLSGLSTLPKYLSFEYQNDCVDAAIACIRERCFSPTARFNLTIGNPLGWKPRSLKFAVQQWVSSEMIIQQLERGDILNSESYGEIFVRNIP